MKKSFAYALCALTALMLFTQFSPAEARHHHSTKVQLNFGGVPEPREAYIVRRYTPVPPAAPIVYAPPVGYYAPVYVEAPRPCVEEVHVVPAHRPRSLGFAGLSFSWNFFK